MTSVNISVNWSDTIVMFNSLLRSIDQLRAQINADILDDDDLFDAEEELNDYLILLARLRKKYTELSDKGELPAALINKFNALA